MRREARPVRLGLVEEHIDHVVCQEGHRSLPSPRLSGHIVKHAGAGATDNRLATETYAKPAAELVLYLFRLLIGGVGERPAAAGSD